MNLHQCPGWCSVGLVGVQEAVGRRIRQGNKEEEGFWKEVEDNGQGEGVRKRD